MTVRRLVALVAVLLLSAAACSSSDDSSTETEAAATATATATETESSEQAEQPTEAATEAPPTESDPTAPPDAAGEDSDAGGAVQVEITTSDGETLTANYTAAAGAPGVVLGHMRGTGKETWDDFAASAAAAGYAVLALDSRGYGGSTGQADTNLDIDLTAGVDFLVGEGAPSVVVIGASMNGTATVVVGSQLDLAGIATLSAPAEFAGLDAVAAAPGVTIPAMVIVAEEDEPYATTAQSLIGNMSGGGQLILFSGSAHGTDLFDEFGGKLTDDLIGFLGQVTG